MIETVDMYEIMNDLIQVDFILMAIYMQGSSYFLNRSYRTQIINKSHDRNSIENYLLINKSTC